MASVQAAFDETTEKPSPIESPGCRCCGGPVGTYRKLGFLGTSFRERRRYCEACRFVNCARTQIQAGRPATGCPSLRKR